MYLICVSQWNFNGGGTWDVARSHLAFRNSCNNSPVPSSIPGSIPVAWIIHDYIIMLANQPTSAPGVRHFYYMCVCS